MISVDWDVVKEHMAKLETRRSIRIKVDPDSLRWTPVISSVMLEIEEKHLKDEVCSPRLGVLRVGHSYFVAPLHCSLSKPPVLAVASAFLILGNPCGPIRSLTQPHLLTTPRKFCLLSDIYNLQLTVFFKRIVEMSRPIGTWNINELKT